MLLLWKNVVAHLDDETREYIIQHRLQDRYVAIFLLSDNKASEVYVWLKAKKAKMLWLYADIKLGKERGKEEILEEIQRCNGDKNCVGVMVQLPLASHLWEYEMEIMNMIDPEKDIDGLGSLSFWLSAFGVNNFLGATPLASLKILEYYEMDDFVWKVVTIIWRSNLIGKPLTMELIKRGATVITCNSKTPNAILKQSLAMSHYIFSATGQKHLVCEKILSEETCTLYPESISLDQKVLVDIGRGSENGKTYGDMDREYFEDKVKGITPVPGGVGPVTVSCLFNNIIWDEVWWR